MDQRPGQNVDLGLYFHREGPVSPKIRLNNRFFAEKNNVSDYSTFRFANQVSPALSPAL